MDVTMAVLDCGPAPWPVVGGSDTVSAADSRPHPKPASSVLPSGNNLQTKGNKHLLAHSATRKNCVSKRVIMCPVCLSPHSSSVMLSFSHMDWQHKIWIVWSIERKFSFEILCKQRWNITKKKKKIALNICISLQSTSRIICKQWQKQQNRLCFTPKQTTVLLLTFPTFCFGNGNAVGFCQQDESHFSLSDSYKGAYQCRGRTNMRDEILRWGVHENKRRRWRQRDSRGPIC